MGLPGSGKTTFAQALVNHLELNNRSVVWFNADAIRKEFDDWDFSHEGRIRQSIRMRELADNSLTEFVVCDFIAPLPEMRDNFDADYTIWMDTIDEGRYDDTNKAFVPPDKYDFRIQEKNAEKWVKLIVVPFLKEMITYDLGLA